MKVSKPDARNPFTDVIVQGHFEKTSGADKLSVTGFCDASDGSVFASGSCLLPKVITF